MNGIKENNDVIASMVSDLAVWRENIQHLAITQEILEKAINY